MRNGIAIAGNIIVDFVKFIPVFPGREGCVRIVEIDKALGGSVCNCGIALCCLDSKLPVMPIGVAGADTNGDYAVSTLSGYANMDMGRVRRSGLNGMTDVMTELGEKKRTMFTFDGANKELDASCFDFDKINAKIMHFAYIAMLPGLDAPDAEYGTVMARMMHTAQQNGILTSADIASDPTVEYDKYLPHVLPYCDYFVLNELEAGWISGIPLASENGLIYENARNVLGKLVQMGNMRWVVVHAPDAVFGLSREGEFVALPSLDLPDGFVQGTVGAGDAFCSGVLHGVHEGCSLVLAMERGIATACCSLSTKGGTSGVRPLPQAMELYHATPKKQGCERAL